MRTPNPVSLIERKRDGGVLDEAELRYMIESWLAGDDTVQEGQIAALLMAGLLKGFSTDEARALTTVLLKSGDRLDLSGLRGPTVDKHSTGGVGDGTTLIVAPLLAAAGVQVVKLSGRGLGHTGGTLDKLESIPGFTVGLSMDRILEIAEEVGCVVAAQTGDIVPADKALYALRDVTGTVPSMALIASSVMSKKLASGADTIILDVKAGDGAFMTDVADARELAELCVAIGTESGRRTRAVVTDMDTPLGRGIGNALEVIEVVESLQRPPSGRFAEVCLTLAALGLSEATQTSLDSARARLEGIWSEGGALAKLGEMIVAQGGDPAVCERPREVLELAEVRIDVTAATDGVISGLPARAVGVASMNLGAGRRTSSDTVDHGVGIELLGDIGDRVRAGDPLARIYARDGGDAGDAAATVQELMTVADAAVSPEPILELI